MVNVVGETRIEIAQRIVRKRGEMNHRVEASHIADCQIAEILADFGNFRERVAEVAARKQVGIKSHHFMTGVPQDRTCHGADIAFMTSQ